MSESYRVRLKESVVQTITASDRSVVQIELTNILPQDQMVDALKDALRAHGFESEGDQLTKSGENGELITVDLTKLEVVTTLAEEQEVAIEVKTAGTGWSEEEAQQSAKANLTREKEKAQKGLDVKRKGIERQVTSKLIEGEAQRRRELNEIVSEVYAESLKRKAGELGEIMEITAGTTPQGQYELVIKVEV